MPKRTITVEEESRDVRFKIHRLINQGFSELHALARVFPGDPNRRRRLKIWQQQGLWPIPVGELELWRPDEGSSGDAQLKSPPQNAAPMAINGMHINEVQAFVTEVVREKISRLFDNVAICPIPKTGKKGRRAIKKAFTVPSDLWTEIEALFPGEIMSNVISAALRLYVNSKKEVDQQNALKN